MGESGNATKVLAPLLLVVLLVIASCGVILATSSDDDACAPPDSISDLPADGSLSPGGKVKPMKSKDFQITSGYGPRDGGFHHGIDLAGAAGAPIYAAADGTVLHAGTATGYGHWIVLDHNINGHKWSTVYGHMFADGVLVKEGQHVTAGQHIANRGNDGQSTGPHLHFEVYDGGYDGGKDIDPAGWVAQSPDPGTAPARPAAPAAPGTPGAQNLAAATPSAPGVVSADDWNKVATLEAGGNWAIDTGNGYQGGLQFSPSTWNGAGGGQYAPTANKATPAQQMEVANRVLGTQGWNAWPTTSKAAGVTGKKPAPAGTFVNAAAVTPPAPGAPAPGAAVQGPSGPLPKLPAKKGSEEHWQIDSIRIARAVSVKFPQVQTIGGWRPYDTYPDHPSGRAIDVMIPNFMSAAGIALGNAVQKYLMDNKKFFHVVYTIWRQRYTAADGSTNIMDDRGSPTQNHFDHVHVTDEGHGFPTGREVYTAPGVTGGVSGDVGEGDCAPTDGIDDHGGVDNLVAGKVPPAFEPWFRKAGQLCPQISSAFLAGIGKQESGFTTSATSNSTPPAEGAMQFLPTTFPGYGKDDDRNGRVSTRDVGDSVMAAGRYSCENAKTIDAAIATGSVKPPADGGAQKLYAEAYNGGVGAILSAGGEPSGGDYDTQTRPYGTAVITYMHDFAKHGLPEKSQ